MAWWPNLKQKLVATTLNKSQRLVCIGITGAMTSCLLNAPEALLGITPLPVAKEKEACQSALRPSNFYRSKLGNLRKRLKVLENFMDKPFVKIHDHCAVKLVLSHRFRVTIPKLNDVLHLQQLQQIKMSCRL